LEFCNFSLAAPENKNDVQLKTKKLNEEIKTNFLSPIQKEKFYWIHPTPFGCNKLELDEAKVTTTVHHPLVTKMRVVKMILAIVWNNAVRYT